MSDQNPPLSFPRSEMGFPRRCSFTGGGWVTGNLNHHDPLCRELTSHISYLTVSVDYRLARRTNFLPPSTIATLLSVGRKQRIRDRRGRQAGFGLR